MQVGTVVGTVAGTVVGIVVGTVWALSGHCKPCLAAYPQSVRAPSELCKHETH